MTIFSKLKKFIFANRYWLLTWVFIAFPLLLNLYIGTEQHLIKRTIYTLIAAYGLMLPCLFRPRLTKFWLMLYGLVYFSYWLNINHYLIFEAPLTKTSMDIIFDSNPDEAQEFVANFLTSKIIYATLAMCAVIMLAVVLFRRFPVPHSSKRATLLLAAVALIFSISKGFHTLRYNKFQLIPYRIAYNYMMYRHDVNELINLQKKHIIPVYHNLRSRHPAELPETYVVVIGESVDRQHLNYYGYFRDTTPFSDQTSAPYIFRQVKTPHASTLHALRKVLTFAYDDKIQEGLKKGSLLNIFNAAGFKTFWLSNQFSRGIYDNQTSIIAQDAQVPVFLQDHNRIKEKDTPEGNFDETLLPHLDKALQDEAPKKIIFLHLMGSHTPYYWRFPPEFDVFSDKQNGKRSENVADYDNSIRYTDYVLSQIVERIHTLRASSYLLYLSDHGDDVYDTPQSCHCHTDNGSKSTENMYKIPFLLWVNKSFKQNNPELTRNLPNYLNRKFNSQDLIHSLPCLSGLSLDEVEPERNLFAPDYQAD